MLVLQHPNAAKIDPALSCLHAGSALGGQPGCLSLHDICNNINDAGSAKICRRSSRIKMCGTKGNVMDDRTMSEWWYLKT